jgi:hypothetical protein
MKCAGYERLLLVRKIKGKRKKDRERARKRFYATDRESRKQQATGGSSFILLLNSHAIRLLY